MFSAFHFYNALREATQRGVETVYSAVTRDVSTGINFGGKTCNLYYIVADETGRVVYNGSGPPLPPARAGALHLQSRAERRRLGRRLGRRGQPLAVFLGG
jgi:hypothetical protein